jgi:hypothetical protein
VGNFCVSKQKLKCQNLSAKNLTCVRKKPHTWAPLGWKNEWPYVKTILLTISILKTVSTEKIIVDEI